MKSSLVLASVIMIGMGLIGSAYAHKSQVIDSYKFEVGWDKEPPVAGKPNNVIAMVSKAISLICLICFTAPLQWRRCNMDRIKRKVPQ